MTDKLPRFEKTYPNHEFSELVRLALVAGRWFAQVRLQMARRSDIPSAG